MSALPDFSAMNETERLAYFKEQQEKQKELVDQSIKSKSTMSALRVRPVFQQAIQSAKSASTSAPVPTRAVPPSAFSGTSSSANNMMRLAFGENPFRPKQRFGQNGFIPDSQFIFKLLSDMDQKMASTRKFIEGAEFWSPLISQYYLSVLVFLQIFRAKHEAGLLSGEAADVYDLFCGHAPAIALNSLPVPGPLQNLLSQIAVHIPHLVDMDNVCPMIPNNLTATNTDFYVFDGTCQNLRGRLPCVPYLLDQIAILRDALNATPIGIDVANQGRILHRTIFGRHMFAINAAPGQTALWNTRVPFANNVEANAKFIACDPAARHPFFLNRALIAQLADYSALINVTQPAAHDAAAVTPSWTQFLGLDNMPFFLQVVRVMSWYSKFWQGSDNLANYSPNGHTAGQNVFAAITRIPTLANITAGGRFYSLDLTIKGRARNPLAPDADSFDAALGPINFSWTPTDMFPMKLGDVTDIADEGTLRRARIGGPFFSESIVNVTGEINPTAAYAGLLNQYYYSSVALKQ